MSATSRKTPKTPAKHEDDETGPDWNLMSPEEEAQEEKLNSEMMEKKIQMEAALDTHNDWK